MNLGGGEDPDSNARGVFWSVASALAFSLSSVVGKDLLGALGVTSLLFWRFTVATAVIWLILGCRWRLHGSPLLWAVRRRLFGLGVLLGFVVFVGFEALERLDASAYIVIVYLYPALVVVISAVFGSRPRPVTWIALGVTIAGVVLTVPELFGSVGDLDALGVLLASAQAFTFAGYIVLSNRLVPAGIDGLVSAGWTNLGTAMFFIPFVIVNGVVAPDTGVLVAEVALFALIPTVAAMTFMFTALRLAAPGLVAMVMTVEVVFTIAWSVIFLGERPATIAYLGAAVVVIGVMLAQWESARVIDPERPVVPASALLD